MAGAATIVIVRPDLSILGAEESASTSQRRPPDTERAFFDLVQVQQPDVIVIDCRQAPPREGITAIHTVRRRVDIPTLIVCEAGDPLEQDYRIAGAAGCLASPFDIVGFNQTIHQIIRLAAPVTARAGSQNRTFAFAGLVHRPSQNSLVGAVGSVKLTSAENNLLLHLLSRPWKVCSRAEIAEVVYGAHRPSNDRAIDLVVTRLRRKLVSLLGTLGENLVKTEFRRGYMVASDVTSPAGEAA
jgi:two-component system OmpR family response regulator